MTGSRASVSSSPPRAASGERVLVCALNWLGDGIMSMPALQALRTERPDLRIDLLVKPGMAALWAMHDAVSGRILLPPGATGLAAAVRAVRAGEYARAYILPHSFRSALVPFLARVPLRVGTTGRLRRPLVTHVRTPPADPAQRHQAWEYLRLFDLDLPGATLPGPRLRVPGDAECEAGHLLAGRPPPFWGLLPGAARGPSKRWPPEAFADVGRKLSAARGGTVLVLGSGTETDLCATVAHAAGPCALSLAGRTDLAGWAALIRACSLVVANDSGGMHMAAALGTPVTAVFGATDPNRTGPLGGPSAVVQAEGVSPDRRIARNNAAAASALAAVSPDRVYSACTHLLENRP